MTGIMDFVYKWAVKMINAIMGFLPTSPFTQFINDWTPPAYIGWLNWFFPVKEILAIMVIWLGSISLFYLYSVIMRWVKIIGD